MDALPRSTDTADMDTTHDKIAALLAQARDITQDTLGGQPPVVVAEVFRALWVDADAPPDADDFEQGTPRAVH